MPGDPNMSSGAPAARLRLMAMSDVHAHLTAHNFAKDEEGHGIGLAGLGTLIEAARAEAPNALLFDNGDLLQGGPVGDAYAGAADHPMISALNALGTDAATLGNHEFNYGLDAVLAAYGGADFPVVCANLIDAETGAPMFPPTAVLGRQIVLADGSKRPLRVGIFGVLPPQVTIWDRRQLAGRAVSVDMVAASRTAVAALQDEGADLIVALCHSGIQPNDMPKAENAAYQVAAIGGIDALVAGHLHRLFPGSDFGVGDTRAGLLAGVPSVMPGWRGSHLGIIDLDLSHGGAGWQVTGHNVHLRSVADEAPLPHPAILALAQTPHAQIRADLDRPVGSAKRRVHSYFSFLPRFSAASLLAAASQAHVAARLADTEFAELPVLGAAAPFKAGGYGGPDNYVDVAQGPVLVRHLRQICPYPNVIAALKVDGQFLTDWLERTASVFCQITEDQDMALLLDPAVATSAFEAIRGLEVVFDLTQPARFAGDGTLINPGATRIREVRYQGAALDLEQSFILATSDYRAGGGGGFPVAGTEALLIEGPDHMLDVVCDYAQQDWDASAGELWRFASLGREVVYRTSPAAAAHLEEIADFHPRALGHDARGFLKVAVSL